jgi:hypothetical protein
VSSLPIVEHLDVFEDVLLGFLSCGVVPMLDELALECSEETLDTGVVPTVPFAAHAGTETVLSESVLVTRRGILGRFNRSTQHWVVRRIVGTC